MIFIILTIILYPINRYIAGSGMILASLLFIKFLHISHSLDTIYIKDEYHIIIEKIKYGKIYYLKEHHRDEVLFSFDEANDKPLIVTVFNNGDGQIIINRGIRSDYFDTIKSQLQDFELLSTDPTE